MLSLQELLDAYATGEALISDDAFDILMDGMPTTAVPTSTSWPVEQLPMDMEGISAVARSAGEWVKMFTGADGMGRGTVSPKLDGMAAVAVYEHGALISVHTRGDGTKGENITQNARRFMPPHIKRAGRLIVRGEIVISDNNLRALNERAAAVSRKEYANQRSAVTIARSPTASPADLALLRFVAISSSADKDHGNDLIQLTEAGLTAIDAVKVTPTGAWMALDALESSKRWRGYLLDGVVYRCDAGLYKLKFKATSAITTVTDIVPSVGRTGVITPVCVFEPIELAGVTVRRATLHAANNVIDGIGVGATIIVSRRGDVIPHVELVVNEAADRWTPPPQCPACGQPTVSDGAVVRCGSPFECPATSAGLLCKYCTTIGIAGVGPGVAAALVSAGVQLPHQLYDIDEDDFADIQSANGKLGAIGRKIYHDLHTKTTDHATLLGGLGIPSVGVSTMSAVLSGIGGVDALRECTVDQLAGIPSVGQSRALSIVSYVADKWDAVISPLLDRAPIHRSSGTSMSGMVVCITGPLSSMPRDEAYSAVRRAGGDVSTSITRKTTHLVCNDAGSTSTKTRRAAQLGVKVINEADLLGMIGGITEDTDAPNDDF